MNTAFYHYPWYQMVLLAFIYGILLWIADTLYFSVKNKKYTTRSMLHLPILLTDALAMLIAILVLERMRDNLFILFLGAAIYGTAAHGISGFIIEHSYGKKVGNEKFHLWPYVGLSGFFYYGLAGALIILFLHPVMMSWIGCIKPATQSVAAIVISSCIGADVLYSAVSKSVRYQHPSATVFAQGYNPDKLIWVFLISAFLGDVTETLFCKITAGVWMSRSSVLFGPFSLVWGFGCLIFTMLFHKDLDKSDRFIFINGAFLGGAYEYLCSVVTEICFGTVFWDYSEIPFNLGGRINLLFCLFWGIAAVIWIKIIYPFMSSWIEKIPVKVGRTLTWIFAVLMAADIVVSCGALGRAMERRNNQPAGNPIAEYMDEHFPDSVIDKIYPNMEVVK